MDQRYADASFEFSRIKYGIKKPKSQAAVCTKIVSVYFSELVNHMYIKKFFRPNMRAEISEIYNNVLESFLEMLDENQWMDNKTKIEAVDKVKKILQIIFYLLLIIKIY